MTSQPLRLRLGVDLDGVVADFNSGWMRLYNDEFGAGLSADAVTTWDGLHDLTHFSDMGEFWRWARGADRSSIFRYFDTYAGSVEALSKLASRHSIVILTTKPGWAVHDTFAWIAEHKLPTREVHILDEKWRVPCDVYLDDAPHQVVEIHAHRPESAVVRFARPWNSEVPGTHTVATWDAFVDLVGRLATGTHQKHD